MDRDLWRRIVAGLKRVPRRRSRNAVYDNRQIMAVLLWSALHNKPVSWACRREHWPTQAWRRSLPDQSTMSRRARDPLLKRDLEILTRQLQRTVPPGRVLATDGKAFELSDRTRDPDARTGWGSDHHAKGYKLHVIIDDAHRLLGWEVRHMNVAECVTSREILERMPREPRRRLLLADASYDSNPLYAAAARRNLQMLAPRRRPHRGVGARRHHPARLRSIEFTERRSGWMWPFLRSRRWVVERFFAGLTSTGVGVPTLPPWVRHLHRSTLWISLKLVINAARIARLHSLRA